MTPSSPSPSVYTYVRRLILDLLERDGVLGAVLLDRDDQLILHEGSEPRGDVEGLAAMFLRQGRAAIGLRMLMENSVGFETSLVRDAVRTAYVVEPGLGTSLLVYVNDAVPQGLLWRWINDVAADLKTLLEPNRADDDIPAQPDDPIWD